MGESFCRVVPPVKSSLHSCFSICAHLRHNLHNCAEQFNLCKRALPENFSVKSRRPLVTRVWAFARSPPCVLQGSEQTQKLTVHFHVFLYIFLILMFVSTQFTSRLVARVWAFAGRGAHPVRCTGLNKLNAGDASVILEHQAVRIPSETGQLILWDVSLYQTKLGPSAWRSARNQRQNMCTLLHKKAPDREKNAHTPKKWFKDDAKNHVRQTPTPTILLLLWCLFICRTRLVHMFCTLNA